MKLSYAGAGVALILAATLAACGGKAQFTVQGSVSGLNNSGLVLANGGNTVSVAAGATSFSFPQQIDYGTGYNITVQTQPAHMRCDWLGGNVGSAGHTISIQAALQCEQNTYSLSGRVTGLTPAADNTPRTVTLLNGTSGGSVTIGSDSLTLGNGDFVLPNVADGVAYGVTVVPPTTPNGLTCTLTNGTGVMHEAPVSNLILTCVPTT
jgi:hypothetical protein